MKRRTHNTNICLMGILLICGAIISSCSKGGNPDPDPVPTERLRLKTFSENSATTTLSYNNDHFLSTYRVDNDVRNIIYDAENRLVQNGPWSYTQNASGQITKMAMQNTGVNKDMQATFTFNNKGLISRATSDFRHTSSSRLVSFVHEYEYDNNDRLISIAEKETSDPSANTYRWLLTYDNRGNISIVKQQVTSTGATYIDIQTISYTYDDKKNPNYATLNSMGISDHLSLVVPVAQVTDMTGYQRLGGLSFFRLHHYNPNNALSYSSSDNYSGTYHYVYNEDDYPISAEWHGTRSNGSTFTHYYNWEYETYIEKQR